MDKRKIVFNSIPFVLFPIYLYVISFNYFQFKTVTNVQRIRYREDMPETAYVFCIKMEDIRKNNHTIPSPIGLSEEKIKEMFDNTINISELSQKMSLSVNGKKVHLNGNPILISFSDCYKCWNIQYENDSMIETEVFQYVSQVNRSEDSTLITRDFPNRIKILRANVYAFSYENYILRNLFIVSFLKLPYETDCMEYEISQDSCLADCEKGMNTVMKLFERKIECSKKCNKKDCHQLITYANQGVQDLQSFQNLKEWNERIEFTVFGENISIQSSPMFPISLFIQQVIGLITMFFEIAVIDSIKYIV